MSRKLEELPDDLFFGEIESINVWLNEQTQNENEKDQSNAET
jgi:hypothetical protein